MIDLDKFIEHPKSLLIAPAGFGKTHTITECLLRLPINSKKQLILTHTHAGVTSIKEKLKKLNVPYNYEVETISSFIQRYVLAYNHNNTIPSIEDSKKYYAFLNDSALRLFKSNLISKVIKSTYSGLFVDEYQDCTKKQHEIIKILAELIPTRILGDFLQGIFEFNESTVDLTSASEMNGFIQNSFELTQPQRWLNGNNIGLGNDLKAIREKLIKKEEIDLKSYKSIELLNYPPLDLHIPKTDYSNLLWRLIGNSSSLLIVHSNTTSVEPRKKITQKFNNSLILIESIDDKLFYKVAKLLDEIDSTNSVIKLQEISLLLFNKTEINNWFNDKGLKRKINADDKKIIEELKVLFKDVKKNRRDLILKISDLPKVKCFRPEVLDSLLEAIEISKTENINCYTAMINYRNKIRRFGRKIEGKCIGTTLLTKGLEFDTVLILDADKFNCPKHFYVAITRACKKLVIVTEKNKLRFN
ncbi:UvrD-helicase domain-containing protein [Flavobacterium sp. XS2P39]|uniref:UvrD-helicase domain-containing protein n=1 Tax=Flavobacterium sp. XS2P39 TaxID=3401725 RepID=UPI003AAF0953